MLSFSNTCKLDYGPCYEEIVCVTINKYTFIWLFVVQYITEAGIPAAT